jgi:tripartite motif-containing protein 71
MRKNPSTVVGHILWACLLASLLSACGVATPAPAPTNPVPTRIAPTSTPVSTTIPPTAVPMAAPTVPAPTAVPTPKFVMNIANDTAPFDSPRGIALDAQGNIYVLDTGNSRVQKFDRAGKFVTQWGSPGEGDGQFSFNREGDVAGDIIVDTTGNVYIADNANHRVQKFDGDGKFLAKWGSEGADEGQFMSVFGLGVDAEGNVFVADPYSYAIQKFDGQGKFLLKWGGKGTGDSKFNGPVDVAVDKQGYVYVNDFLNGVIQKFDGKGNFVANFSLPPIENRSVAPVQMIVDQQDNMIVTDPNNYRIVKFDPDGKVLMAWGNRDSFNQPWSVAVDEAGNIYVGETATARVRKFSQP